MRLAQLARKIGITQSEIVRVLSENGFETNENGNTKLSDKELTLIYDHFNIDNSPEMSDSNIEKTESENIAEQTNESTDLEDNNTENLIETEHNEEPDPDQITESSVELQDPTDIEPSPANDDSVEAQGEVEEKEVIRAKKVKLEGIKVVGKIELPEPKQSEEAETETKEAEKEKPTRKKAERKSRKKNKGRKQLSYSDKVKREEEQALKEKKRKERRIKEKKKKHYFEKVQPKVAAKPKKKTSKKKVQNTAPKRVKPQYKNPIRKFWAWLNGEYDV